MWIRVAGGARWLVAGGSLLFAASWLAAAPLAPQRFPVVVDSLELVIPYQGSHPLEGSQPQVERVVVAIHGSSYSPQSAYNAVVLAAGSHAGPADAMAIFAPQFLDRDEVPSGISADLLYWNNFPFRGTASARYGPTAERVSVSLFEVLDQMLEAVTDPALFPNLKTVVIVGHSAGGQAVNRYAIAGRFESTIAPARGIHLRYLVLAPSSYLYFSPERDPDGNGVFEIPSAAEISACGAYDEWGYGLEDLWSYPAATGEAAMRAHYPQRFVFYLVGENDDDPNDDSLATDCAAMLQGPHRVARAQTYFAHLLEVYGEGLRQFQSLDIVPGVGHSYAGQLNSTAGRRYLLDKDPSDTDGDGQTDWLEWMAGTDPADSADRFAAAWTVTTDPVSYQVDWPALPGRRYVILGNTDLVSPFFEMDSIVSTRDAPQASWQVESPGAVQFLQVEVRLK